MAHIVKCPYCEHAFDTEKTEYVKINQRRYAHKECYERMLQQQSEEERDKQKLEAYIKQLFNIDILTPKINKQLKDYITINHYTYSGILGTLKYFFEVKHNSIEKANGGIGM